MLIICLWYGAVREGKSVYNSHVTPGTTFHGLDVDGWVLVEIRKKNAAYQPRGEGRKHPGGGVVLCSLRRHTKRETQLRFWGRLLSRAVRPDFSQAGALGRLAVTTSIEEKSGKGSKLSHRRLSLVLGGFVDGR